MENGADKIRINPGNIGSKERIQAVVDTAKERNIPIRVGVNSGSLEKELVEKYHGVTAEGLVESALDKVHIIEEMGYDNLVISIKSSDVLMCARAHELIAEKHSILFMWELQKQELCIREISNQLSDLGSSCIRNRRYHPCFSDRRAAGRSEISQRILKTLGLRKGGVEVVSCPTCGRTKIDLIGLANQVETMVQDIPLDIKVAVMGCVVNGPGEAKEADLGIAGGDGVGLLIRHGEVVKKYRKRIFWIHFVRNFLPGMSRSYNGERFFDVFPHLKVKKELEELLDMVFVTKVSMNPGRTHLRVYIESSRWIHKKNIFALEDEIERQCFPGIPMTVTVVEKFHLSEQYTPENFLESYRSSMEMELRNYNMLEYNLFRRSKIIFTGKRYLAYGASGYGYFQTEKRNTC